MRLAGGLEKLDPLILPFQRFEQGLCLGRSHLAFLRCLRLGRGFLLRVAFFGTLLRISRLDFAFALFAGFVGRQLRLLTLSILVLLRRLRVAWRRIGWRILLLVVFAAVLLLRLVLLAVFTVLLILILLGVPRLVLRLLLLS